MSSPALAPDRPAYGRPASPPGAPAEAGAPARRRSPLRMAVEGVALLALFGAAIEAACRVEDWVRYRTPILARARSQSDLLVRDADGAHGRANARYQKWVMNSLGMRGPEASARKPAGTYRIVTAGASETYGLYESPDREYPRQLEDSLRAAAARCGAGLPRFEVLNAAMPGMSLPTIAQDVRTRLGRLQVDAVLIYPTPAGFLDLKPPVAAVPDSSPTAGTLPARFALYPRVATRVRNQIKLLLPGPVQTWLRERETAGTLRSQPPGWRFEEIPADRLALFERDLRATVGAVRAIGATPVLATHANTFMRPGPLDRDMLISWEKFYPRAPGRVIVAFDSAAREVTLRVARDSGVTVADVARRMAAAPGETFADFVHFTDAGAAHVADALTPALLAAAGGDGRGAAACPARP